MEIGGQDVGVATPHDRNLPALMIVGLLMPGMVDAQTPPYRLTGTSPTMTPTRPSPVPTGPAASREFRRARVSPGDEVEVTITTSGFAYGGVEETLPPGFGYIEGSITPTATNVEVDGQVLSFIVTQGAAEVKQFSYGVMAVAKMVDLSQMTIVSLS